MMRRNIVWPLWGICFLLLGGCSATEKRLSAKEYYAGAGEAFSQEDFLTAADQYQDLLDQYPLNPYAEEAQLKIGYSRYLDKKYTEALAAFSDFERMYPTSSHLPFVQYYRGMAYLDQMRSFDRDQSVTEKADDFFRLVSDHHGESSFAPLAEEKSRVCRESIAQRELYVADFHLKKKSQLAAKARLRGLVEEYPETDAAAAALARLQEILTAEGKTDLAEMAAQAAAVRKTAKPQPDEVATPEKEDLPAPGVDPLLTLVTELKKQENEARQLAAHPPGGEGKGKQLTKEEKNVTVKLLGDEEQNQQK